MLLRKCEDLVDLPSSFHTQVMTGTYMTPSIEDHREVIEAAYLGLVNDPLTVYPIDPNIGASRQTRHCDPCPPRDFWTGLSNIEKIARLVWLCT